MSRIDLAAFETIDHASVRSKILKDYSEFRLPEHIHDFVYAFVDGSLDEGRVIDDILNLEGHVAYYHGKGKILHRTGTRICFEPLTLRIGTTLKNTVECLACYFRIFRIAGCLCQLSKCHAGECVGENVVGLNERLSLTGKGKIEVVIAVVTIFLQEFRSLDGCLEPLRTFLKRIVEHGEHPDFPSLKPDEFVSVIDTSISVQTGEITSEFLVLGFFQPEWEHIVKQFTFVLTCQ